MSTINNVINFFSNDGFITDLIYSSLDRAKVCSSRIDNCYSHKIPLVEELESDSMTIADLNARANVLKVASNKSC